MNNLKKFTLIGFLFVLIAGTLSHFVYNWSGNNFVTGFFFPINESTWEHMKLVFFPMLIYAFYMYKKLKSEYSCMSSSLSSGILAGTLSVPVLFFLYTGFLGKHVFLLDLLTFFISVLIGFFTIYKGTLSCKFKDYTLFFNTGILIFFLAFILFTYNAPSIGLFANPA